MENHVIILIWRKLTGNNREMIFTAMPPMVFLCSRFQKIADSSAILDDLSHQVEFSSKQVACQCIASHSDFLISFSAIWSGTLSCPDFRDEYKNFQLCAEAGSLAPAPAFCYARHRQPRISALIWSPRLSVFFKIRVTVCQYRPRL